MNKFIVYAWVLIFNSFFTGSALAKAHEVECGLHSKNADNVFTVYDATLYKDKPDMTAYGIQKMPVIYVSRIWPGWRKLNEDERQKLPEEKRVRELALLYGDHDHRRVVIDVEHWNIRAKGAELKNNVDKYIELISWFKEANPSVAWGYFARPPVRDFKRSILDRSSRKYKKWQLQNQGLKQLADYADIIYPSLYTETDDQEKWVKYAQENIREARCLGCGKPVIPFFVAAI